MVRYLCDMYPNIRVPRGDGTYMDFKSNVFDAYFDRDVAVLDRIALIRRDPSHIGVAENAVPLDANVVQWNSPLLGTADGYGNSAERMMIALERNGMTVSVEPNFAMSSPETLVKHITDRPQRFASVRVAYQPPNPSNWMRRHVGQAVLGFSMWEDDLLPPVWDRSITQVDAIAVPSRFCQTLFEDRLKQLGAAHIPVVIVPLGVEASEFPYRKREYAKGHDVFTVLHSSTMMQDPRKGALEAYAAFRDAFIGRQDVKLILRAKFGELPIRDDRVEFSTGVISEPQKRALIERAHVYLYPSFGEGFGLMPLEAIASGCPSIVSANTAMLDYVDLTYAVRCTPEASRITTPWQKISMGKWARPSHDEMVTHLRTIQADYQKATHIAARRAKIVRRDWTYDQTAIALKAAIEMARSSAV